MRYLHGFAYAILLLFLCLYADISLASSKTNIDDLKYQSVKLLQQCLPKPNRDWHFGSSQYLSYHLPGSACQLMIDAKHRHIAHAKLIDNRGNIAAPSQCQSPALTCLGLNP